MNNSILHPQLAVFDLELVLLRVAFLCFKMPYRKEDDNIFDRSGKLLQAYPEVSKVFQTLKSYGIKIGIIESIPPGCPKEDIDQIITWFKWDKYISYKSITKEYIYDSFKMLLENAHIPASKTVLFTMFEGRNYDVLYQNRGFTGLISGAVTDRNRGMTLEILMDTLKKYKSREQGEPISHETL